MTHQGVPHAILVFLILVVMLACVVRGIGSVSSGVLRVRILTLKLCCLLQGAALFAGTCSPRSVCGPLTRSCRAHLCRFSYLLDRGESSFMVESQMKQVAAILAKNTAC